MKEDSEEPDQPFLLVIAFIQVSSSLQTKQFISRSSPLTQYFCSLSIANKTPVGGDPGTYCGPFQRHRKIELARASVRFVSNARFLFNSYYIGRFAAAGAGTDGK